MVHAGIHHAVPALLQIRPQLNIRLTGGAPIHGSPLFSCGQRSNMPPKSPEKSPDFAPKNANGNKACACLDTSRRRSCRGRLRRPRHPRRCAPRAPRQAHASSIKAIRQLIRAPEKDLHSKDFLGRGAATAQNGQVASASCLKSAICGDESARRTGRAADPLALPCCSRRAETCFYAAPLAFSPRSRHPSSWQYAPYPSAHSGTEER